MDRSAPDSSANLNNEFDQLRYVRLERGGLLSTSGRPTHVSSEIQHPASDPVPQNELHSKTPAIKELPKPKPRIVIAISGGPSSGKSTLAYLLAAVFEATTIQDTGFAGARSMFPVYDAEVDDDLKRRGPIAKVVIIDQNRYLKDVTEMPTIEWTELQPYSPVIEIMKPKTGLERVFASARGGREWDRYWEEAYRLNVGIDPEQVTIPPGSRLHELALPRPVRVPKSAPNIDCRGAIDWMRFGGAIRDGMAAGESKGILETEEERETIEAYLAQPCSENHVPLVDSRKIEPLRQRVRDWIKKETQMNNSFGFLGRSIVEGFLKPICIINGPLLFLQSNPAKEGFGEKLMQVCNVKLFLPTLETEAIQRCFNRREYMDPPEGTREPGKPWMYEGYFCEVAWPEYVSEHSWLFENRNVTGREIITTSAALSHEVHVREFYTANLKDGGHEYKGKRWSDETLDWAVRTIIFQLSMDEAVARRAACPNWKDLDAGMMPKT